MPAEFAGTVLFIYNVHAEWELRGPGLWTNWRLQESPQLSVGGLVSKLRAGRELQETRTSAQKRHTCKLEGPHREKWHLQKRRSCVQRGQGPRGCLSYTSLQTKSCAAAHLDYNLCTVSRSGRALAETQINYHIKQANAFKDHFRLPQVSRWKTERERKVGIQRCLWEPGIHSMIKACLSE